MTNHTRLKLLLTLLVPLCARASIVSFYDEEFQFQVNGVDVSPGVYAARLGTFDAGVFTALVDDAFIPPSSNYTAQIGSDPGSNLLAVGVEKNNNAGIPPGTQLALAVTTLNASSDFGLSSPSNTLILKDPNWLLVTLNIGGPDYTFGFTSSTYVVLLDGQVGGSSFSYNGGSEVLDLVTIPEPGSFALVGGLTAIGLAGLRRRRQSASRE